MNKNYLIIGLSLLSVSLILYIIFNEKSIKNVALKEPTVKTIIKEKVVYLQKDRQPSDEKIETKKELSLNQDLKKEDDRIIPIHEVQLETEDKKQILSQANDDKGRFHISLISNSQLDKKIAYEKKVILHTKIYHDNYEARALLTMPPSVIGDIDNIMIRVKDAQTDETFDESAYCLQDIVSDFNYIMKLSINGSLDCEVIESEEAPLNPSPLEINQDIKDVFNKFDVKR